MNLRRLVAVALVAGVAACKDSGRGSSPLDAGAGDTGAPVREANGAPGPDAAAAPDDAVLPTSTQDFVARAIHLLDAIREDNPSLAADILYPRDAWLATRDAEDPGKDWERRVADPFRRAVHVQSRRRPPIERPQSISLELGHTLQQSTPRKHGWKKPIWTVTASKLTFVIDGVPRTLAIREMAAWRGAWYVTRLR